MKMPRVLLGSSLLVLVCVVGVSFRAKSDGTDAILKAKFNADGSVNLPAGYRNWTHVGTRIKAIGINILDGLPTKWAGAAQRLCRAERHGRFRKDRHVAGRGADREGV